MSRAHCTRINTTIIQGARNGKNANRNGVITITKLLKDSETETPVLTNDVCASLEAVAQELAGPGALVEVVRA